MSLCDVSLLSEGPLRRIRVSGELDIEAVERLDRAFTQAERDRPERVVLDLTDLRFMDSIGLRSVLAARARAQDGLWSLEVLVGQPAVQRLLAITGADQVLTPAMV